MKALTIRIEVESRGGICYIRKEYQRSCDVMKALRMIDFYGKFGECFVNLCVFHDEMLVGRTEPLAFPRDLMS